MLVVKAISQDVAASVYVSQVTTDGVPTVTEVGFYDEKVNKTDTVGGLPSFDIVVSYPFGHPEYSIENLSPGVCTTTPEGHVTEVGYGVTNIQVWAYGGVQKVVKSFSALPPTSYAHKGYKVGSYGEYVTAVIDGLILDKTPGATTQNRWGSYNGSTAIPVAVENSSHILYGKFSLEATTILRSDFTADVLPAHLITPRHIFGATHAMPQIGTVLTWKTPGGLYRQATVRAVHSVRSSDPVYWTPDVSVAYLDTDIVGITPYKVLPRNWRMYLSSLREFRDGGNNTPRISLPVILKSYRNAPPEDYISRITLGQLLTVTMVASQGPLPTGNAYKPWGYLGLPGDSQSPILLPYNGELLLLGSLYSGGATGGFISENIDLINSALVALAAQFNDPAATSYALTEVDLSAPITGYPSGFTQFTTM
jgi:hypothetical protein